MLFVDIAVKQQQMHIEHCCNANQVMSEHQAKRRRHRRTQLAMLSPVLAMDADMHRVAARKRKVEALSELPAATNTPNDGPLNAPQHGVTPCCSSTTSVDETPHNLRRRTLEGVGVGERVAASWTTPPRRSADSISRGDSTPGDASSSEKENSPTQLPFTAMRPVNVLVSLEMLTKTFEETFMCPSCCVPKSLEVEYSQFGLATEIYITCKKCNFSCAMTPLKQEKIRTGVTESPQKRESNRFHDYSVNYLGALLQQKLGMGLGGLEMIMAFIGIAPSYGSDTKWNILFDRLGSVEESVCNEVIQSNLQEEIRQTRHEGDKQLAAWLNTAEGQAASEEEKTNKHNSILMMDSNKIGITIGADGAWQKRSIGRSSYNSTTGHNFGVGGCSNKIVSLQCFSKHCRHCEEAKKKGIDEPKTHRCPRNFDAARSAKSMEAQGAIQHCTFVAGSQSGAYVAGVVTDDDSTTRSNLRHSLKDVFNHRHGVNN